MHVSIIDDEKILADRIGKKLENNGYAVSVFHGYRDFMRNGDARSRLYVIDISLWDGTGFDIVRWLRKNQRVKIPIIVISGYGDTQNVIYWLDLWADDYLTKPFVPDELVARVRALLRRPDNFIPETVVRYGDISFHTKTKETFVCNKKIHLTKIETLVLECFITNQETVVSREKLVSEAWGGSRADDISDNTLYVMLSNLRRKLGSGFALKTLYNQGYVLE